MGHILDMDMRCFTFAKVGPCCYSLAKHLYFPGEQFFFFFLSANKNTRDKREKTNLHITSYRGSGD